MKVYIAEHPDNHGLFLKTVSDDLTNVSHLRFDLHFDSYPEEDEPFISYVTRLQKKQVFYNTLLVNKPDVFNGDYFIDDYANNQIRFKDLISVITHLNNTLKDCIVIDVDPDILKEPRYKTGNGLMTEEELSTTIKSINKNILYFFFASTTDLAERVLNNAGLHDLEFISLIQDQT